MPASKKTLQKLTLIDNPDINTLGPLQCDHVRNWSHQITAIVDQKSGCRYQLHVSCNICDCCLKTKKHSGEDECQHMEDNLIRQQVMCLSRFDRHWQRFKLLKEFIYILRTRESDVEDPPRHLTLALENIWWSLCLFLYLWVGSPSPSSLRHDRRKSHRHRATPHCLSQK